MGHHGAVCCNWNSFLGDGTLRGAILRRSWGHRGDLRLPAITHRNGCALGDLNVAVAAWLPPQKGTIHGLDDVLVLHRPGRHIAVKSPHVALGPAQGLGILPSSKGLSLACHFHPLTELDMGGDAEVNFGGWGGLGSASEGTRVAAAGSGGRPAGGQEARQPRLLESGGPVHAGDSFGRGWVVSAAVSFEQSEAGSAFWRRSLYNRVEDGSE
mmetsp:Transcript_36448/g.102950  ORF Transcript_36448/g.102950 Transcript_36448/m.102950 type:complete len:212 (-) Transcript_36448:31-666(-)